MLVLHHETPEDYLNDIRIRKAQNCKNVFGIPTLCEAIFKFRSVNLVRKLLQDGAKVNAFTSINGRLNVITRDRFKLWGNYSAIHEAVSLGQYEIVSLLLEHGAGVTLKTTKGIQNLDFIPTTHLRCLPDEIKISQDDDLEILKLMQNKGMDLTTKDSTFSQSTVLHRAVEWGCNQILQYLISLGYDVNCLNARGSIPLHHCAKSTNIEVAKILLENNANPNSQDELGNTLLHRIFSLYKYEEKENNLADYLRLLHIFDANPNVRNNRGETALHVCLDNIQYITYPLKIVSLMLTLGADPNIKDVFERTPVYRLVPILKTQNPNILQLTCSLLTKLINNGAKLDYVDITGTPLLHDLVTGFLSYSELSDANYWVEILQPKYKINLNVQDYFNRTVLHLAAAKDDWKLGQVILNHGGNLNAFDCDGNKPLDIAMSCKQWEFAKNLLVWQDFRWKQPSAAFNEDTTMYSVDNNCRYDSPLSRHLRTASDNSPYSNVDKANSNCEIKDKTKNKNDASNDNDTTTSNSKGDRGVFVGATSVKNIWRPRRSKSMSLSTQPDYNIFTPLGSRVKWTKNKLDAVVKFVENNEFYITTKKPNCYFCEKVLSPAPQISKNFTQVNKFSLLRLCEENSLKFHLTTFCGEEHCLLAQQVSTLVHDLLTKTSEMDSRLTCQIYLTGSSAEGTKMGLPDEFDFLIELVELKDCFIDDTLRSTLFIRLKDETAWSNLCDGSCILSPRKIKGYISALLWKAALELNKQKYPNIDFNLCRYNCSSNCFLTDTNVGVNLTVSWNGEIFKNLTVSIDVTPAVPVVILEHQMSELHSYASKKISDRCSHVVPYLKYDKADGWRPSFSLNEVEIIKSLTKKQISLYKCLKFLRDLHGGAWDHVPSYHLKTFLLTALFQNPDDQGLEGMEQEDFYSSASRLILKLKHIVQHPLDERVIQHFFLKFPLSLAKYDLRWCCSILEHLESRGEPSSK